MGAKTTRPARGQGGSMLPAHDVIKVQRHDRHGARPDALKAFLLLASCLLAFLYLPPDLWTSVMRMLKERLALLVGAGTAQSAPPGFPSSGNGLWYRQPGKDWNTELLPIGNGYLAAMIPGGTHQEVTQLNLESLWTGGPFQDPAYNGSNWPASRRGKLAKEMQQIRNSIFASLTGTIDNVEELAVPIGDYGSYAGAGYLLSTLDVSGRVSDYFRWLDLDNAVARTQWTQNGTSFLRTSFCSNPAQACIEHINASNTLPTLTYALSTTLEAGLPVPNVTCLDSSTLDIRGQVGAPGMVYELLARVQAPSAAR
ncbi:hypothetical protein EWM64_g7300, partial [Hericium alpestre]